MVRHRQLGYLLATFVLLIMVWMIAGCASKQSTRSHTHHAELEYLKAINLQGPPEDPQILFLLMQQYLNSNQQAEGIEVFSDLIDTYNAQLEPWRQALYLSALGLMRASYANEVPLLRRIRWVNETIDILERARELSQNDIFVVRWITGVVYAQLPARFRKGEAAERDLQWCVENRDKAPGSGWLREVYYQLGAIYHQRHDHSRAQSYLRLSGYPDFNKPITLTTNFSVTSRKGFSFQERELKTIVPDKVYSLSGFEFTEFYFVVSDDRRELIAIAAGTRPDSARDAYTYLKSQVPSLPPLTTVLITHAHWDHIGGHRYFQQVNPQVRFYIR
ncbi:hypothetical protein C2W62_40630 [Candidatus Entotheonella serta]|nr:hypothetical protein C2W62_40630 [Candidatus Entotheonella serta]